jgi:hypothetical protein
VAEILVDDLSVRVSLLSKQRPDLKPSSTPKLRLATLRVATRARPSLRSPGFEESLSAVAQALSCQPLEVGLASEARSTNQGVGEGGRTTTSTKPFTSPSSQSGPAELEERESFGRKESEFGRQLRGAQIGFSELARNDERLVFQVLGALGVRE